MPTLPNQKSAQIVFSSDVPFNSTTPALGIDPAQQWIGNDGPWSPVLVGVGTPRQFVSLLISTSSSQPLVVLDEFCGNLTSASKVACARKRGNLFAPLNSTSWNYTGRYTLDSEANLGVNASGKFARETIQLGVDGTRAGSFSLPNQTVAGIVNKDFWIATWGIRPDTTNITSLENRTPSLLSNLKSIGKISSLSWGYTAGAVYRYGTQKTSALSLTLGGTDVSRYQPHNTTFDMVTDPSRDLVVGVRSIKSNTTEKNLAPTPFLTLLDAGVSQIWLPKDACKAFEEAFGLTYNTTLGLYPVNDTLHQTLLQKNPTITFTIGNDLSSSNATVDIKFPYASFDLLLSTDYRGISQPTRYFPLRQAANASQYTLGRTFFQEAYVIADYERFKFSVHQTVFPGVTNQTLVAIPSPATTNQTTTLSTGASIGIAMGVITFIVLVLALILRWRRKTGTSLRRMLPFHKGLLPSSTNQQELHGSEGGIEVPGNRPIPPEAASREKEAELENSEKYELPDGNLNANEMDTSYEVFELPGSDCVTLADQSELPPGKEMAERADPKTWLCEDYVNKDYSVDDAASIGSTLCTRVDEKDSENPEMLEQAQVDELSANKHCSLSPMFAASEETREQNHIQETVHEDAVSSVQHDRWSIDFGTPRHRSPVAMTEAERSSLASINKPNSSSGLAHEQLDTHPANYTSQDSETSHQSESEISALSPRPTVSNPSGSDTGSATQSYVPRKHSIVSPL